MRSVALQSLTLVHFQIRWLKVEQKLIDLDLTVKRALHFEHPDMGKCMDALDQLSSLDITALMLKKQPDIVTTIRKLRKYVGPHTSDDPKIGEEWMQDAQKIRLKANQVHFLHKNLNVSTDAMRYTYPYRYSSAFKHSLLSQRDRIFGMSLRHRWKNSETPLGTWILKRCSLW